MIVLSDIVFVLLDYGERIATKNVHLSRSDKTVRLNANAQRKELKTATQKPESANADLGITVLIAEEDVL